MPAVLPADLLAFLRDLAENNDKNWFEANKTRYERSVKEPALAFISAFAEPLAQISPHFQAIAKGQGGSLFRIYRDTRFSHDKRPYKTNTGMHFRHEAGEDAHAPGFYLHLEPGDSGAGVGIWMPDGPTLNRIRETIAADVQGWAEVKRALEGTNLKFMGRDEALKKPPRGVSADHPHVEDLKLKSFAVSCSYSDAEVLAPDFMARFAATCQAGAPLAEYLCRALGLPF